MDNYNFKDFNDLKKFINQKKFEKIFLITGKNLTLNQEQKKISPLLRFKKIYNSLNFHPTLK